MTGSDLTHDRAAARPSRRSQAWFGASGRGGMLYRSWLRNPGHRT